MRSRNTKRQRARRKGDGDDGGDGPQKLAVVPTLGRAEYEYVSNGLGLVKSPSPPARDVIHPEI